MEMLSVDRLLGRLIVSYLKPWGYSSWSPGALADADQDDLVLQPRAGVKE